jgi:hypothetical protein
MCKLCLPIFLRTISLILVLCLAPPSFAKRKTFCRDYLINTEEIEFMEVIEALSQGNYELSYHAVLRMEQRDFNDQDIRFLGSSKPRFSFKAMGTLE